MPLLKPIAGHTGCGGIKKYLEKNGRARGILLMNFQWEPLGEFHEAIEAPEGFDWAYAMDATRHGCGNDTPYKGKQARTFKHFVLSPDPQDGLSMEQVAELAKAWTAKHFGEFEAAIVLHDDNEGNIPHAHIVVNNTNVITERRLHTDDPLALNRSLQDLARERGFRFMSDDIIRESKEGPADKRTPATMQQVYLRRSEREIAKEGGYSWVTDIRSRVTVAKALARNEDEFMAILDALEVDVADNSAKSWRRDWIYSLRDCATWRVGGEKLGLSFGKESLQGRFARMAAWRPGPEESRRVLAQAHDAVVVNDLAELGRMSDALETCMAFNVRSVSDIDRRIARAEGRGDDRAAADLARLRDARECVVERRLLPSQAPKQQRRTQAPERGDEVAATRRRTQQQAAQAQRRRERDRRAER